MSKDQIDIQAIISLLVMDEIFDALEQANKIPFEGEDKTEYIRKKKAFSAGLKGQERSDWIEQMKVFLRSNQTKYGNSALKRWHHLDKKELKKKIRSLWLDQSNLVKCFLIERNPDYYATEIHNILKVHCEREFEYEPIGHIRGNVKDHFEIPPKDSLKSHFIHNIRKNFDIPDVPFDEIPTAFKKEYKQVYFVVQSLDNFSYKKFKDYLKLWADLKPMKQLFLFFYLDPHSLTEDIKCLPNYCLCRFNDHENVCGQDFDDLFTGSNSSSRPRELIKCEPMSFSDAVEKLEKYKELI